MKKLVSLTLEVERPNHHSHATLLAEPLGNDLYEIRTIPILTNALNFGDVVKAVALPSNPTPLITEIVIPSGYRTLRIVFLKSVCEAAQREIIYSLHKWQATHEAICDRFYAISVSPDGDIQAIRAYLDDLKRRKFLIYEPDIPLDKILLEVI